MPGEKCLPCSVVTWQLVDSDLKPSGLKSTSSNTKPPLLSFVTLTQIQTINRDLNFHRTVIMSCELKRQPVSHLFWNHDYKINEETVILFITTRSLQPTSLINPWKTLPPSWCLVHLFQEMDVCFHYWLEFTHWTDSFPLCLWGFSASVLETFNEPRASWLIVAVSSHGRNFLKVKVKLNQSVVGGGNWLWQRTLPQKIDLCGCVSQKRGVWRTDWTSGSSSVSQPWYNTFPSFVVFFPSVLHTQLCCLVFPKSVPPENLPKCY